MTDIDKLKIGNYQKPTGPASFNYHSHQMFSLTGGTTNGRWELYHIDTTTGGINYSGRRVCRIRGNDSKMS